MDKHIEKEYKILLSKEKFMKLYTLYNRPAFHTQTNTYFDTVDNQLQRQKAVMRIRQIEDTFLFTLKMWEYTDLMEYECVVKDSQLSTLQEEPIYSTLSKLGIHAPFQTLTTLTTKRAVVETELYELCFDISTYNNTTDFEVEYEYKKEHDGFINFNHILAQIDTSYKENAPSKIARALMK